MGNLFYLKEHNLITGGDIREPGQCRSMIDAEITKEGLDFIENEGGLKAILDQSVIHLERDELFSFFLEKIRKALKNSQQIDSLRETLEQTATGTLEGVIMKMLARAIEDSPELLVTLLEESAADKRQT